MSDAFHFKAGINGEMEFPSEYARSRYKAYLIRNPRMRFKITPLTPESDKQRKFFEGAVVPLFTYYQENLNWKNSDDLRKAREWLKLEFNSEFLNVKGIINKVALSTKGKLNVGFLERVTDWMEENGYDTTLLDPEAFKWWRDTVYASGNADTYIDYLIELGKLKSK